MTLRRIAFGLGTLLLVGCANGGTGEPDDGVTPRGREKLVGGLKAKNGQWPSTMIVQNNCTVSKVGPRHILTAAHCVHDDASNGVKAEFAAGAKIKVSNKIEQKVADPDAANGLREVEIAHTHIHPLWIQEHPNGQSGIQVWGPDVPPDVAIIELTAASAAKIKDVPTSSVDLAPVAPGDKLVIMGYGCESGASDIGASEYDEVQLKYKNTTALPLSSQNHDGSKTLELGEGYTSKLGKQYLFTPGIGTSQQEASICPGDSGGPVYRDNGNKNLIVGVNAYYSFSSTDTKGISVTNWHTRLDLDGRADVGSWLASLGVSVVHGPASSERYGTCQTDPASGHRVCGAFLDHWKANNSIGAPSAEARFEMHQGQWVWTQVFASQVLRLVNGQVNASSDPVENSPSPGGDPGSAGSAGSDPGGDPQGGQAPQGWTCDPAWYGDGVCDCACGPADSDCPQGCNDGQGGAPGSDPGGDPGSAGSDPGGDPGSAGSDPGGDPQGGQAPQGWTCDPAWYGDGVCDCTCGPADSDCPQGCNDGQGAAGSDPGGDPQAPGGQAPQGWTCDPSFYADQFCDSSCGVPDPDCQGEAGGQGGEAPQGWTCDPSWYGDGEYCDQGCGAPDPDCGG